MNVKHTTSKQHLFVKGKDFSYWGVTSLLTSPGLYDGDISYKDNFGGGERKDRGRVTEKIGVVC
jgi:hypothetical protein